MHSKQLHYFVMTVRKGSIAAAARALDIAQPAISQQLASLEREMKATLLERSFSGVNLTSAEGRIGSLSNRTKESSKNRNATVNRQCAFFTAAHGNNGEP